MYCANTNEYNRLGYEHAKKEVEKAYNIVTEKDLSEYIKVIEKSNMIGKHRYLWELINKITGRITSRKGQINGATATKGIENWFQHFKNLLGNKATIEDESEEIAPIFNDVEIRRNVFSMDEYEKVKSTLVSGKASGEKGSNPKYLSITNLMT